MPLTFLCAFLGCGVGLWCLVLGLAATAAWVCASKEDRYSDSFVLISLVHLGFGGVCSLLFAVFSLLLLELP